MVPRFTMFTQPIHISTSAVLLPPPQIPQCGTVTVSRGVDLYSLIPYLVGPCVYGGSSLPVSKVFR